MDKSRIIELLARKLAGEATPVELEQLDELITRYPKESKSENYDPFSNLIAIAIGILVFCFCIQANLRKLLLPF